jgi:hypothetical protein
VVVRVKWIFLSTLPIKIVLLTAGNKIERNIVQRFVNWVKTRNLDAGDISWDVKEVIVHHIDKYKLFLP